MKIAVGACLSAKWYVNVYACHVMQQSNIISTLAINKFGYWLYFFILDAE